MEMFNDLRGDSEIRDNYQFWFYLYPDGAAVLVHQRRSCAKTCSTRGTYWTRPRRCHGVGPDGARRAQHGRFRIAKLQTLESGDEFWSLVSDTPLEDLKVIH